MKRYFIKTYREDIKNTGVPALDYHIHANYADGACEISDIVNIAKNKGLTQIAITEHLWKGADWINSYIEKIEAFNKENKDFVLIGAETRIINTEGDLNIDTEQVGRFDLIIGSLHRYPGIVFNKDIYNKELSAADAVALEEKSLIAMIRQKKIDVVGHIGRSLETYFPGENFPESSLKNIINEAKNAGVTVEINARSKNVLRIFASCVDLNCPMSFGTDSHRLDTIGEYEKDGFLKILGEPIL